MLRSALWPHNLLIISIKLFHLKFKIYSLLFNDINLIVTGAVEQRVDIVISAPNYGDVASIL